MQHFQDHKHFTPIQIRFKDVDLLGHVNHANHLTYLETARTQYFKDVIKKKIDWSYTGMILARVEMDYRRPIFLNDEIFCTTKVAAIGNKSFTLKNLLLRKTVESLEICAEGICTIVCMDYRSKETIPVPEDWRKYINDFENHDLGN